MTCKKPGRSKSLKSIPNSTKSKGLERALFGSKGTKLKPASVEAQRAWQGFPAGLKKELRKTLPDYDGDGVPNGFDCRPRNKKRQESFLPVDAAFLNSNPQIALGKKLSEGGTGEVFEVKGNRHLVVKTPRGFADSGASKSTRVWRLGYTQHGLEEEYNSYSTFELEKEPLFIPTKRVNLGEGDLGIGDIAGLVRPKVAPVFDYTNNVASRNLRRLTISQLETIRRKLINLSHKGYMIKDGLQIGLDITGRPLIYDFGGMKKYPPDTDEVFDRNNEEWVSFLAGTGFLRDRKDLRKYGTINRQERY